MHIIKCDILHFWYSGFIVILDESRIIKKGHHIIRFLVIFLIKLIILLYFPSLYLKFFHNLYVIFWQRDVEKRNLMFSLILLYSFLFFSSFIYLFKILVSAEKNAKIGKD